jgi:putative DNA primase/helicase
MTRAPSVDLDRLIETSGVSSLNFLSPTEKVAETVRLLVTSARRLDEISRAQLKSKARKILAANDVDGGPTVVTAAFREADAYRERAVATSQALCVQVETLPPGVLPFTDLANAHRLQRDHGGDLRYVDAFGWLVWDGKRWGSDTTRAVERFVHKVACSIEETGCRLLVEASQLDSQGRGDEGAKHRATAKLYREWAQESQQGRRIRECVKVAQALDGISVALEALDTDPWLFTCANGTINLHTGTLREHRREDLITRASPVAFDDAAVAATWDRFQTEVHPDTAVREFNQRHYGYSLTGIVSEHVLIVCHGGGRNGKSTETEAVRFALGDYATEAASGTFIDTKQGRSSDNKLASLRGARLVTTSESGEGNKLNETLVKRATGGDELTANFLYKETFRFHPQFKLRLITNHRPELTGVDEGIWRRLRLVPYAVDFAGREDLQLPDKLRAEAPGVLAWLVRGCLEWQRIGLLPPTAVQACTKDWRAESNHAAQFVDDCCVKLVGAQIKPADIYAAYLAWSREQGIEPMTLVMFGRRLSDLGYAKDRTNSGRFWLGLGLIASNFAHRSMSHVAS